MSYEDIFDQSYERVKQREIDGKVFFHAFYDNFLDASPKISAHFAHTDMLYQIRMMEKSFYSLFIFYATKNANDYLQKIAEKHDQGHANISPELYDVWLDNLIKTVAVYDPQYNDEVALAWRIVMAPGISYMKFKFPSSTSIQTPHTKTG